MYSLQYRSPWHPVFGTSYHIPAVWPLGVVAMNARSAIGGVWADEPGRALDRLAVGDVSNVLWPPRLNQDILHPCQPVSNDRLIHCCSVRAEVPEIEFRRTSVFRIGKPTPREVFVP